MSLSIGSPGSILFLMPSMAAIMMALKAKYGLQLLSGQRNSMRLVLGFSLYMGMRIGGRAIATAINEIYRRFVTRHQPLVAVGGGIAQGAQGGGVFEDAADGVQAHLAQAGIFVAGKERAVPFPQGKVHVHAASRCPGRAAWA